MTGSQADMKTGQPETDTANGTPAPPLYRSVVVGSFGASKHVKIENGEVKTIEKNEVEVKVEACGINFQDIMLRQGFMEQAPKPPFVMGLECAGIISKVGEDVKKFKVGDRVVVVVDQGAWTERLVVPIPNDDEPSEKDKPLTSDATTLLLPWPSSLSASQAAGFAFAYLPAYYLLFQCASVRPGDVVLVHSAGGSVGIAIGQLAKAVKDVKLIGTASSHKHEKIASLYDLLLTPDQDYVAETKKAYPAGVDVILDCLGEELIKSESLLKPLGKFIQYGTSSMVTGDKKSILNMAKNWLHVEKFTTCRMREDNRLFARFALKPLIFGCNNGLKPRDPVPKVWEELTGLIKSKKIDPLIDTEWSFEEVKDAMQRLQERKNIGKVILNPNAKPPESTTEKPIDSSQKDPPENN